MNIRVAVPQLMVMPEIRDRAAQALFVRRHELGLSQEEVANAAGSISQRTISELERGKYSPDKLTAGRAAALARALKWTLFDLQEATGVDFGLPNDDYLKIFEAYPSQPKRGDDIRSSHRVQIPVLALAAAGAGTWTEADVLTYIEVEPEIASRPNRVTFQVDGDSMEPTLSDGDFIHVDFGDNNPQDDKIYVVHILANGIVVKRVREYADSTLHLVSDNPRYAPIRPDEAKIIGRVFAVTPKTRRL